MPITRPNQKLLDRFDGQNINPNSTPVSEAFKSLAHLINDTCPNSVTKVSALQKLLLSRDNTMTAFHQRHDLVPTDGYTRIQPKTRKR